MSTLQELLARVEGASGEDPKLDADICAALRVLPITWREPTGKPGWTPFGEWSVTGSIDASLALVEMKLPGWHWRVDKWKTKTGNWVYTAMLGKYLDDTASGLAYQSSADAATPPLAILAALLNALISEGRS